MRLVPRDGVTVLEPDEPEDLRTLFESTDFELLMEEAGDLFTTLDGEC